MLRVWNILNRKQKRLKNNILIVWFVIKMI